MRGREGGYECCVVSKKVQQNKNLALNQMMIWEKKIVFCMCLLESEDCLAATRNRLSHKTAISQRSERGVHVCVCLKRRKKGK